MDHTPESDADTSDSDLEDGPCYCKLDGLMDLLSREYAMQMICLIGEIGPARYSDIETAFGDVSSSTLSARLDELADAGYLAREQYPEIPPRVEYDLTPTGEQLCRRLQPLLEWANEHDE